VPCKKRRRVRTPWDPSVCARSSRVPRMYVCMYVYITKGSSFGRFSEILGMTSEARGSRTRNTDFSIARILADELPGANIDARKWRKSLRCDSPQRGTRVEERVPGRASNSEKCDAPSKTRRDTPVVAERRQSGNHDSKSATRWTDLTWLQYTRYKPPRLPRKSVTERRIKRRAGDHPRIPFSSSQLQVLEDKYKRSAYLSKNDVVEMSATLRLPQSKVGYKSFISLFPRAHVRKQS